MPGSPTAPGRPGARDSAPGRVAFRQQNCVGTRISWISRLNGWPARSPTDASTPPSRVTPHGSGPMWVATPSSQWTCTTYSLPVSRRTLLSTKCGHSLRSEPRQSLWCPVPRLAVRQTNPDGQQPAVRELWASDGKADILIAGQANGQTPLALLRMESTIGRVRMVEHAASTLRVVRCPAAPRPNLLQTIKRRVGFVGRPL